MSRYTAFVAYEKYGVVEVIDVDAEDIVAAQVLAQHELDTDYEPGGVIIRMTTTRRTPAPRTGSVQVALFGEAVYA